MELTPTSLRGSAQPSVSTHLLSGYTCLVRGGVRGRSGPGAHCDPTSGHSGVLAAFLPEIAYVPGSCPLRTLSALREIGLPSPRCRTSVGC